MLLSVTSDSANHAGWVSAALAPGLARVSGSGSSEEYMFYYAADDGEDSYFDNPLRKHLGPSPPWWVQEAACCLCGCLSAGPVFLFLGLIFLVRSAA